MFNTRIAPFIVLCLVSTIVSFIAVCGVIAGSGSPTKDIKFQNSLMEWTYPGFFATYDFRHYMTAVFIFALMPFAVSAVFKRKLHFVRFYRKHRNLTRIAAGIFSICLVSVVSYLLYTKVYREWDAVWRTLQIKPRGKQLIRNITYIPLFVLLYGACYGFIRSKSRFSHPYVSAVRKSMTKYFHRIKTISTNRVFDPFIFLIIFLLIFNPAYKYSYEKLANFGGEANHQFHHTASYIGPIHELLHGKTPLVDAFSQYGVLAVSIPALIFSFVPLSFSNFTLYSMIVAVLYTVLFYMALGLLAGSRLWAVLGTFLFIKLMYFRWFFQDEIFIYPSSTPLRYAFDIIVFFAVLRLFRSFTTGRLVAASAAVGSSVLYNVEIGLSLFVAAVGSIGMRGAIRYQKQRGLLYRHIILSFVPFFLTLCFIGILVYIVTYISSHQYPDWSLMTKSVIFFGRGFLDIPAPVIAAYYFPLSVYLVTYYVLLRSWFTHRFEDIPILTFLLLYGLVSFVYYLGFNEQHHLMTIIHPSVMLGIFLGARFTKHRGFLQKLPVFQQSIVVWYVLILSFFFLWEPGRLVRDVPARFYTRYAQDRSSYHDWDFPGAGFFLSDNDGLEFVRAASAIDARVPKGEGAFILSRYDTLLFVMSDRPSAFNYSYPEYEIVYKDDLAKLIKDITKNPPKYAFVASEGYKTVKTDNIPFVWEAIKDAYRFTGHAGAVEVYERI